MGSELALSGLIAGAVTAFYLWLGVRTRRTARDRLIGTSQRAAQVAAAPAPDRTLLARYRLLPGLAAGLVAAGLYYVVGLQLVYCVAGGLVVGLLGLQIEQSFFDRRMQRIESQLADAIDIMVGALRAGVSVLNALEHAFLETHWPLRPQLEEVVGRIRLGDDPQMVFRDLQARVPLETFFLFASALSVHWEVGGNLAPTLATVGRTIRDRIELSRRIRSMSAQSRISTISVLCATYFIALVIWRSDPRRMEEFLSTSVGSFLVAGVIFLQAIGIVWSAAISRVKF